ncbi:MAG: VWA-like domain-containing protein, partial [Acidobacteriota bacterium]|nr:VWA-like domain-containing protein [Acidobacteriota bacterium]
ISVEQAYDRLPEPDEGDSDDSDPPGAGDGSGADAAGTPTGDGRDPSDRGDHGEQSGDGDDREADGSTEPSNDDGGPGNESDDAPASCDPAGTGEVMDAPVGGGEDGHGDDGPSARDAAAEEQAWDEAMHQALSLAKAEGKAPGGIEETVRGAHAGTLDWRSLLRCYMTDAAKSDYSWSVPNRRFIDSGLYLPSIRSEGMEAIAVIIDTSGSLPAATLAAFWAELREVATEIRPESVVVLQVDAAVQDAAEYAPDDLPDEIAVKGRGGTDFRPGFEWLDEQGIRPAVCLYFTDMECSRYPGTEPSFPTVWVNYSTPPADWNREPWGERIDIPPGPGARP